MDLLEGENRWLAGRRVVTVLMVRVDVLCRKAELWRRSEEEDMGLREPTRPRLCSPILCTAAKRAGGQGEGEGVVWRIEVVLDGLVISCLTSPIYYLYSLINLPCSARSSSPLVLDAPHASQTLSNIPFAYLTASPLRNPVLLYVTLTSPNESMVASICVAPGLRAPVWLMRLMRLLACWGGALSL